MSVGDDVPWRANSAAPGSRSITSRGPGRPTHPRIDSAGPHAAIAAGTHCARDIPHVRRRLAPLRACVDDTSMAAIICTKLRTCMGGRPPRAELPTATRWRRHRPIAMATLLILARSVTKASLPLNQIHTCFYGGGYLS